VSHKFHNTWQYVRVDTVGEFIQPANCLKPTQELALNAQNVYVEFRNADNQAIQLSGWTLQDIAQHVYTFRSFEMQPGQVCRVYTNEVHPEWCGFSYGSGSAIWNNTGDCAYLMDGNGTEVHNFCY
jgi:hypothetical protein